MEKVKHIIKQNQMVFVLIGLCIVCGIISPNFLKISNLLNVAQQVSVSGIMSVAMTLAILTGGIDLTVGSTMACSTLIVAMSQGIGGVAAVVLALLFGFIVGSVNGILITRFKLQAFITTLAMMSVLKGIGLTASKGSPVPGTPDSIKFLGQAKIGGYVPFQVLLFALVVVVIGFMLKKTKIGRYTYAIGGNAEAARLSGINVAKYTTLIYGIGGVLCAFAGIIMATYLNVGEANLGNTMENDCIAAAVIGGTSLKGGIGTVHGTVIGVLIIGILSNLLNLINMPTYTQLIFKGAVIVVACILQTMRDKRK